MSKTPTTPTPSRSNSEKTSGWRSVLQAFGSFLAAVALVIVGLLANAGGIDIGSAPPATPVVVEPLPTTVIATTARGVTRFSLPQGFGARKGFWEVLFTAPTGDSRASTYVGGIDTQLAAAIDQAQRSIDFVAYELNLTTITEALIRAKQRGVVVRVVTDDADGLNAAGTTLSQLTAAGIPIITDSRRALMHNKFVIIDNLAVWMGSWNFTVNDTYRNNNNVLILRSQGAVANYQAEFNEMFNQRLFGPSSPSQTPRPDFRQDGIAILTHFAPEDDVLEDIVQLVQGAQRSIRFMTFSFTVDSIGSAMLERAGSGVAVQGIFETTGSETQFSEMTPLFCAGLSVRQDGNPFRLHHKVFIVDDQTVLAGSFNISDNAVRSNDENLIIITDRDLAAEYIAEFDRRWAEARLPQGIPCS